MTIQWITILGISLYSFNIKAQGNGKVNCQYSYGPMAILTVESGVDARGKWSNTARAIGWGIKKEVSVTLVAPATETELYQVWLAKDDPNNEVQLILYRDGSDDGLERRSKAINPKMPKGWGILAGVCRFS